jgi:hypothetical protein
MKKNLSIALVVFCLCFNAQVTKPKLGLPDLNTKVNEIKTNGSKVKLSNEEVIQALRDALSRGATNSAALASQLDGFYKNPRLFIPWPQEATDMRNKLVKIGMTKKIEEFEMSLNRAAEEAALKAGSVFIQAIKNMSVQDGFAILNGNDSAATNFLRQNTYSALYYSFLPIVKAAVEKVQVTSYWNPLATAYNKFPGVTKQNPNLDDYVSNKTINGLMLLIADEEKKIRTDPAARTSDILKKVFGSK